jgi:hypothetical protein
VIAGVYADRLDEALENCLGARGRAVIEGGA